VLGETLTGGFVFGGAVVCLAVWLVTSPARAVKSAKAQACLRVICRARWLGGWAQLG
jgi:hypothetical protein